MDRCQFAGGRGRAALRGKRLRMDTVSLPPPPPSPEPMLTRGQLEVARLFVCGLSFKDISDELDIQAKSVEVTIARIRGRLGARNGPHLAALLVALELVDSGPLRSVAALARINGQ